MVTHTTRKFYIDRIQQNNYFQLCLHYSLQIINNRNHLPSSTSAPAVTHSRSDITVKREPVESSSAPSSSGLNDRNRSPHKEKPNHASRSPSRHHQDTKRSNCSPEEGKRLKNLEKTWKQIKTLENIISKHCTKKDENDNEKVKDGEKASAACSSSGACGTSRDIKQEVYSDYSGHSRTRSGSPYSSTRQYACKETVVKQEVVESVGRERKEQRSRTRRDGIIDSDREQENNRHCVRNRSRSPVENGAVAHSVNAVSVHNVTNGTLDASTEQTVQVKPSVDFGHNKSELQLLGEKFAGWFYENINSHNPVLQKTAQDFGPQHFWDDVYLVLTSETPDPSQERFSSPFVVSQRFLAFAREELLLFNPNISQEGVFVRSDPHGLVMILVCGTIHRNNECLGTFQQTFGIVKDPRFENNWKIKMSVLKVKTAQVTAIPKLERNPEGQMKELMAPP